MKTILIIFLFGVQLSVCEAQGYHPETSIRVISRIFNNYIKVSEGADSKENETKMEESLRSLVGSVSANDIQLLINVWMYYDPTDFKTRVLIEPIFIRNKNKSLEAINTWLKNKRKSDDPNTELYSDLIELQKRLVNN